MKKILFPTDFSETAANAFIYALHLAEQIKAEIITLHVYQMPSGSYLQYYDYMTGAWEVLDLEIFENYKNEIPQLRKIAEENNLAHIPVSHTLDNNDVISAITTIVNRDKIDYVVMGTKGATDIQEIFVGSFAEKVIRRATVPVLVIPKSSIYRPIKKIMFTTKFHDSDISVLEELVNLAEGFNADIACVYIKRNDEDITKNKGYQVFKNHFSKNPIRMDVRDRLDLDVEETLLDVAKLTDTDLLVMSPDKKGFFEKLFHLSLTKRMTFHADLPLLIMPKK